MVIGKPAPFVSAFVEAIDDAICEQPVVSLQRTDNSRAPKNREAPLLIPLAEGTPPWPHTFCFLSSCCLPSSVGVAGARPCGLAPALAFTHLAAHRPPPPRPPPPAPPPRPPP